MSVIEYEDLEYRRIKMGLNYDICFPILNRG